MTGRKSAHRMLALGVAVMLTATGCAFQGLNSLPLPGAVGRGAGATIYHVEIANVGTLESNSPVMMKDVVVGSVGKMTFSDWHADVEVSVRPDVVIPANAVATVGQTSLLGSMHLALDAPLGQPPRGRLESGATIPLDRSSAYPSTEQTLASVSAVVSGGGLGQIGDIIHNLNAALSGRESDFRDLLTRLDRFVGALNAQRDNLIGAIQGLDRLAGKFAGQRDVIARALHEIPPALDVLIRERPRLIAALDKLRVFSDTATRLVTDTQADLVKNLQNLGPTLRALADVGAELDSALTYALTFPFPQDFLDRGFRGDYINVFATVDLTINRLKRGLLLGTRWGQEGAPLVPAPGDPYYLNYSYNPLAPPITPSLPAATPAGPLVAAPPDPAAQPPSRPKVTAPSDFPPLDVGGG
jgi:phospholipid/cholesterol/gamma-HCH transport system substrate-binding protein